MKTDRRTFLGLGVSAFAAAGVLPLFARDDRQQWYEPEVSGDELLNLPVMDGFKPTAIEIKVGARKPFAMLHISDSHLVLLDAGDLAKSDRDMFEAQFAAIKAEFAKELPTVLAYHIPFYTQDLAEHSVNVVQTTPNHWARKILKSVADLHSGWLAACPGKGDLQINKTLVEWLPKQKNLKALLCGHKHFEYRTQFCDNVTQYICGATFNGNAYHIRFT